MQLRAVAFDIDGTLYPNWQMFLASLPTFLLAPRAVIQFGKVRREIRSVTYDEEFYTFQNRLLARRLGCSEEHAGRILERRFYDVWKWSYGIVRPFAHLRETMLALQGDGFALGVLSDFPPARKLESQGLADLPQAVICSEETGYLKPHAVPFLTLARSLELNPEEILYVGNNYAYDVLGARAVGMRTAYLGSPGAERNAADIYFTSYPGLRGQILSLNEAGTPGR
jgi:putative hydrolase of the HAD superfamily